MSKILKVELSAAIVLIGFFLAVAFHYIINFYYHAPYPYNTFLFVGNSFSDFYNDYLSAQHLAPYLSTNLSTQSFPVLMATSRTAAYFPAAYLWLYPFTFLSPQDSALFNSLLFTCIIGLFCKYYLTYYLPDQYKSLNCFLITKNIFILTAMSYPVLFTFERGNAESLLFVFLALFLYFYTQQHTIKSVICLAAAISMKLYPVVFLILFLKDKHYKPIVICLLLTFLFTIFALLIYKGPILYQLHIFAENLTFFKSHYIDTPRALQFNSSYFSLFETFYRIKQHIPWLTIQPPSSEIFRNYTLFTFLFFACIVLYILTIEKILWKKIALLTASMILLPYISFDHKLLLVYLPFFIFVNADIQSSFSKSNIVYTTIFALLFIPKNYYLIYGHESIAPIINTMLLTLLVFLIIIEGFLGRPELNFNYS